MARIRVKSNLASIGQSFIIITMLSAWYLCYIYSNTLQTSFYHSISSHDLGPLC